MRVVHTKRFKTRDRGLCAETIISGYANPDKIVIVDQEKKTVVTIDPPELPE